MAARWLHRLAGKEDAALKKLYKKNQNLFSHLVCPHARAWNWTAGRPQRFHCPTHTMNPELLPWLVDWHLVENQGFVWHLSEQQQQKQKTKQKTSKNKNNKTKTKKERKRNAKLRNCTFLRLRLARFSFCLSVRTLTPPPPPLFSIFFKGAGRVGGEGICFLPASGKGVR